MKLLLACLIAPVLCAQQGAKVQGIVVNAVSQEPLNKVLLILRFVGGPQGPVYATESTGGGKFIFQHVAAGKYQLSTQRQGFITEFENAQSPGPRQVLVEGSHDQDIVLKMEPMCVIRGKVTDADGDPLQETPVMAMKSGYNTGKRQLNSVMSVMTDDRGEYRLFGLAPGKYYVHAANTMRGQRFGSRSTNAATFFPSTIDAAEAAAVNVAAGGEARGIDITLRREAVFKVSGTVPSVAQTDAASSRVVMGRPRGGYSLRLIPGTAQSVMSGFPMSMNEENGTTRFEFSGVPPGSYVVAATRFEEGHNLYSQQKVQVGSADVTGVALSFVPSIEVTGKAVFEGQSAGAFEGIQVRFAVVESPHGNAVPIALLKEDGTFVMHDVPPEVFDVTINSPGSCYLKAVRVGGQMLAGRQVDFTRGAGALSLVLASDFAKIEGSVKDEKGTPVPRVRVTAIPVGPNLGRMDLSRFAFTDEKGYFQILKLPPGDYKMFAWDNVDAGAPQDPDFRKPYEKLGKEVHLGSSAHETSDLTVIKVVPGQ